MNNGYRERMAKTCAPLVKAAVRSTVRPAHAQPPELPQLAVDQILRGAMAARRQASSQWPIRPGAYGRSGPRCRVPTSCGLRPRWFNRAAVGAAPFIEYLPQ
jgi:hypothetical protein